MSFINSTYDNNFIRTTIYHTIIQRNNVLLYILFLKLHMPVGYICLFTLPTFTITDPLQNL